MVAEPESVPTREAWLTASRLVYELYEEELPFDEETTDLQYDVLLEVNPELIAARVRWAQGFPLPRTSLTGPATEREREEAQTFYGELAMLWWCEDHRWLAPAGAPCPTCERVARQERRRIERLISAAKKATR